MRSYSGPLRPKIAGIGYFRHIYFVSCYGTEGRILAESAADRNNSFSTVVQSLSSSSFRPPENILGDEGGVRENFFPRTQLMRSLSFLLVTYYTVLRLFVTQIVLVDVPSSRLPVAVAGAGTIKNCVAGETHGKGASETE